MSWAAAIVVPGGSQSRTLVDLESCCPIGLVLPHWTGRPGTLLCRAPLRTRACPFPSTRLKQAPQARRRAAAFDAVKIRCRNRRTSSSTRRPSMACQSKGASSGPFTTTVAVASNLSSGSGASVIFLLTGSPDRVSALSRPGTRPRYPAGYPKRPPGGGGHHVPVSRCLSAAGIRFSVIRFPPGSWALLAVGLPDLGPDLDGVTAFRTRELRPGWVPSLPRGRRCSSRPSRFLDRRLPLYRGQSLHPAPASHRAGLRLTRHQREFKQFTRPTIPLACGRPDGTGSPRAFPRASHPADQEPTTHAEVETGHRARTWNYTLDITFRLILQSCSSLTTCDLASHIEFRQSRTRCPCEQEHEAAMVNGRCHISRERQSRGFQAFGRGRGSPR